MLWPLLTHNFLQMASVNRGAPLQSCRSWIMDHGPWANPVRSRQTVRQNWCYGKQHGNHQPWLSSPTTGENEGHRQSLLIAGN